MRRNTGSGYQVQVDVFIDGKLVASEKVLTR
jgi:hypothetical protein